MDCEVPETLVYSHNRRDEEQDREASRLEDQVEELGGGRVLRDDRKRGSVEVDSEALRLDAQVKGLALEESFTVRTEHGGRRKWTGRCLRVKLNGGSCQSSLVAAAVHLSVGFSNVEAPKGIHAEECKCSYTFE